MIIFNFTRKDKQKKADRKNNLKPTTKKCHKWQQITYKVGNKTQSVKKKLFAKWSMGLPTYVFVSIYIVASKNVKRWTVQVQDHYQLMRNKGKNNKWHRDLCAHDTFICVWSVHAMDKKRPKRNKNNEIQNSNKNYFASLNVTQE